MADKTFLKSNNLYSGLSLVNFIIRRDAGYCSECCTAYELKESIFINIEKLVTMHNALPND